MALTNISQDPLCRFLYIFLLERYLIEKNAGYCFFQVYEYLCLEVRLRPQSFTSGEMQCQISVSGAGLHQSHLSPESTAQPPSSWHFLTAGVCSQCVPRRHLPCDRPSKSSRFYHLQYPISEVPKCIIITTYCG